MSHSCEWKFGNWNFSGVAIELASFQPLLHAPFSRWGCLYVQVAYKVIVYKPAVMYSCGTRNGPNDNGLPRNAFDQNKKHHKIDKMIKGM